MPASQWMRRSPRSGLNQSFLRYNGQGNEGDAVHEGHEGDEKDGDEGHGCDGTKEVGNNGQGNVGDEGCACHEGDEKEGDGGHGCDETKKKSPEVGSASWRSSAGARTRQMVA